LWHRRRLRRRPHGTVTAGLRFWKGPYAVDEAFAKVVWNVAWDVVTTYPPAGVPVASP
jgi:hypothetical protein